MTAEVILVTDAYRSARYDGTNGADLIAAVPGATLVSDTGGMLTFTIGMWTYELAAGLWLVWRVANGDTQVYGLYEDAVYTATYTALA